MLKALIPVLLIGAAIGFLMPAGSPRAPSAPRSPQAKAALLHAPAPRPGETRITRSANGHFYVDARVNAQPVRFLIDTGATGVALTVDDARRAGIAVSPGTFEIVGTGASGPVRGQRVTLERIDIDGKSVSNLQAAVVEGLETSLLGQSYLSQLASVEMSGDSMVLR
jgi:aspartyl protease family protein